MKRAHVAVALTVLTLALTVYVADPDRILESVGRADPMRLLQAAALTPVVLLLRTFRWYLLARREIPQLTFGMAWRSYLGGLTLAVVTPLSAGELGRGVLLGRGDAVRLAGLTFSDKLADLSWVLVLGALGLAWALPAMEASRPDTVRLLLWTVAAAVPVGWLLLRLLGERIAARLPQRLGRALRGASEIDGLLLGGVAGLSGLGLLVYLVQGWLALTAVAPEAPLHAMAMWPAVTLSTILPAFAGGVGPREASASLLLPLVGVEAAPAATAAFLQFLVVMVLPAGLGCLVMGRTLLRPRTSGEDQRER